MLKKSKDIMIEQECKKHGSCDSLNTQEKYQHSSFTERLHLTVIYPVRTLLEENFWDADYQIEASSHLMS